MQQFKGFIQKNPQRYSLGIFFWSHAIWKESKTVR